MPAMSAVEQAFCRSAPWRGFARKVVLPWALQGLAPRGDLLELGSGSGAMAEGTARAHPDLPFEAGSFDVVASYLMLHHVIGWEQALGEAARVLRPGGTFVGYDLDRTRLAEWVHIVDRSPYQLIGHGEFEPALTAAGFEEVRVSRGLASHVVRFTARRSAAPQN